MLSDTIYRTLINHYSSRSAAIEKNIFFYQRESDLILIGRDDFTTEMEVKIGKQDFRRDFKKGEKHGNLNHAYDQTDAPNYFYFVAPLGMVSLDDIPNYAGLIEIKQNGLQKQPKITKKAPLLHNRKLSGEDYKRLYLR
jgi:hypothetical protein